MTKSAFATLAIVCGHFAAVSAAHTQDLAGRIARVGEGAVRLTYAARPAVCGNGAFIGVETPSEFRMYTAGDHGFSITTFTDVRPACRHGPVLLKVIQAGGGVIELRAAVGATWLENRGDVDLGVVPAAEAAAWLLEVATTASDQVGRIAFLAAAIADSAQIADRVMAIARDRTLGAAVRERAIRWIEVVGVREGRGVEATTTLKGIAADRQDVAAVRERAVRELGPSPSNDAFLRDLYREERDPAIKERIIRRIGESKTDENAAWVGSLATDTRESLDMRERAIRVLGDELGLPREVRRLYATLAETSLKERALRVVAERGDAETSQWLRAIVEDRREPRAARERALRLLAERGELAALPQLYSKLDDAALRERVIRLMGESPSVDNQRWVEAVALDPRESASLRERAIRMIGESGGIGFLQEAYSRIDVAELRERVIRVVAEAGGGGAAEWLRAIVLDRAEDPGIRERAVRVLAELGTSSEALVLLYDEVESHDLRERLVRIFGERGDRAGVDKLAAIVRDDPDPDLRRAALRRLGESKSPRARQLLEGMTTQP